ncbi:hypothetical protein B0H14DRAFT_3484393 [Mycena olivaceomarginata]|nr:hypothetical protein B0H14DRAFT_3484393 [Mycena olivaceomarginata]
MSAELRITFAEYPRVNPRGCWGWVENLNPDSDPDPADPRVQTREWTRYPCRSLKLLAVFNSPLRGIKIQDYGSALAGASTRRLSRASSASANTSGTRRDHASHVPLETYQRMRSYSGIDSVMRMWQPRRGDRANRCTGMAASPRSTTKPTARCVRTRREPQARRWGRAGESSPTVDVNLIICHQNIITPPILRFSLYWSILGLAAGPTAWCNRSSQRPTVWSL